MSDPVPGALRARLNRIESRLVAIETALHAALDRIDAAGGTLDRLASTTAAIREDTRRRPDES